MSETALTVLFWFAMLVGFVASYRTIEQLLGLSEGTGDPARTLCILIPAAWALPYVEYPLIWLIGSVILLLCAVVLDIRDLWKSFKDWRWRRSHPEEYRRQLEEFAAIEGDFEEIGYADIVREWAKKELARRRWGGPSEAAREAARERVVAGRLRSFILDAGLSASFYVDVQLLDDDQKREARFLAPQGLIKVRDNKVSLAPKGLELLAAVLGEGTAKERLTEMAAILAMGDKVQEDPAAALEFCDRVQRFIDTKQEDARPGPSRSKGPWRDLW